MIWPVLILGCAAAGLTVSELKLRTGRDALIDPADEFSQSWSQFTADFSSHGDLIVVVETKKPDKLKIRAALDQIANRLRNEPDYFRDILYRIDQREIRSKGLQFLTNRELQEAARRVDKFADAGDRDQWDNLHLASFSRRLRGGLRRAHEHGKPEAALLRNADRFVSSLDDFLSGTMQDVRYTSSTFPSPWQDFITVGIDHGAEDQGLAYLMTDEQNMGWLHAVVVPQEKDLDPGAASVLRLREICAEVETSYRDTGAPLKVSVTGIPALEHDELSRAGHDMILAALLAIIAVGGLLSFGFRNVRHPMLVLLTLVVALSCTFGVATLTVGHLNILSVCFASILIGLGVDFGVHFLSRYLHIRQTTHDVEEALKQTGRVSGGGIITSAMTTALAFGSASLTGYPGLAELGIITGSGILICVACTFLFLPALIAISDAGTNPVTLPGPIIGKLYRRIVAGIPLIVAGVSLLAVTGLGSKAIRWHHGEPKLQVNYDSNLMHLQDPDLPSVQAQRRLWQTADESLLYAIAVADSRQDAVRLSSRMEELPSVHHVSEVASWLRPAPDQTRQQRILNLRNRVAGLARRIPSFSPARPRTIGTELDALYHTLRVSRDPAAVAPAEKLDRFLNRFVTLNTKTQTAVLSAYQDLLAGSLMHQFQRIGRATSLDPVRPDDIPAEWRNRLYRRIDGKQRWLVKIYPARNIWNQADLTTFVQDIRTVDPEVTGAPVQNYESFLQLQSSWKAIAVYSLAIISLFLLFDFLRPGQKVLTLLIPMAISGFIGYTMQHRTGELNLNLLVTIYLSMVVFIALVVDVRNLRDTILALLPPLFGAVVMAGAMTILQVDFNPLNLIVLPLVLGIGVDDGIHIVHDYRHQVAGGSRNYSPSGETLTGVILTSLTSIIGFGSLVFVGHQGLVSVGIVMAIGVAGCLLVALVPLPAILTLLARHQPTVVTIPAAHKPTVPQPEPKIHATAEEQGGTAVSGDENRPMTRREKRRLARAA